MSLDTIRIRLIAPQIQLIRPGLADLVAEHNYARDHGRLRVPRLNDECLPVPLNLPSPSDMATIISALDKLNRKTGKAARLHVTAFELCAMILGVRLTGRLIRLKRLRPWRWDQKKAAKRLIKSLEWERRHSIAKFVEVHGPQAYDTTHQWWQETMRVIRRDLVPSKSVLRRGVRRASKGRLMMVKEAADLAAQGLQTLGYKVPEDRTLQQVLRKRMLSKGGIRSALKNPDRMTPAFDLAGFVLAEISDLERVPPKPQTHAPRRRQLKSKQIANHGRTAKPKQQPPKAKTTAPARQDDSLAFLAELPAQFLRERWGTMPPLERAQVLTEMLSYGASRRQIARWLGIDEKTVRNVLKLAQLPPQYKALLKRKASVRRVLRDANDVDLQQRLRVERDNQTGEHSRNVAQALIEILEQEPNLFPGERAAIARELGRDPTDIRKQRYKNVLPAWDLQAALLACKPHRAAVLDTLTTMDFYTTWIVRAVERLAPEPEIRDRAARIFLTHRFK